MILLALLLCCLSSLSSALLTNDTHAYHGTQVVETGWAESKGGGPVWVVQISDLHFSAHYPQRALSFKRLLPPLLRLINPSLVLITGDLTDGKSKDLAAMRQNESEWVQYRDALDWVVSQSGLPLHRFFDIRGNHDKFGVPKVGGYLDYFSKYSITARQNRSSSIQSITILNGDWTHLFVGIDLSMEVGLCGPCNLFGHASDQELNVLDRQLSQWDSKNQEKLTKIVFGHFPTSFIAGTKDGKRPEEIFAKHNISAYICGHLHYQFGKNLLKHHMFNNTEEFWEWELGDWKESRAIRILAIDHGHASFLDLDLSDLETSSFDDDLWRSKAFVLITYPLDARKMLRRGYTLKKSAHDSVRALIFSHGGVVSAKALVYDIHCHSDTPVEELILEQLSMDAHNLQYFTAPMNFSKYSDSSPSRFFIKVTAFDSTGKQIASDLRPFSFGGHISKLRWSWKEYFVMGIAWDALYCPLLWAAFGMLLLVLIAPKLYLYFVLKKVPILGFQPNKTGSDTWNVLNEVLVQIDSDSTVIWWMQLLLIGYLICMPWFWGRIFGDDYPLGRMSVRGWSVNIMSSSGSKWGLGVPDIMVIVLPFLYHILLPSFVLVFALYAEQAFVQIHVFQIKGRKSIEPSKPMGSTCSCKLCSRWLRKALLIACLGVAYLHAQHTWAIVGAYGKVAMLISPGYVWSVPILLATAARQNGSLESICSNKQKIHSI